MSLVFSASLYAKHLQSSTILFNFSAQNLAYRFLKLDFGWDS